MILIAHKYIELFWPFILGLIMGSFANVCIHRLPRKESIVLPASHCPACNHPLGILDNIPLVSFLLLRGRCRYCKEKISWRYPLVELLTGVVYFVIAVKFRFSLLTVAYMVLAISLIIISFIDLQEKIIPDELSLPGIVVGLILSAFLLPIGFVNSLIGMAVGGGILLLIAIISKGGMGGGDVKLMAMIGSFLGWPDVIISLFLAVFMGAIVGVTLMTLGVKKRKDAVPFGPFLALGAIISLFYGSDLLVWYLDMGLRF